tara:strand:- start:18721 stop:19995 length:1275 start_codon:yes stop_codon:yes gene_type:complete
MKKSNIVIGIVGLGYVGLPLTLLLSKKYSIIAFDKNKKRIDELNNSIDSNGEFKSKDLQSNKNVFFSNNIKELSNCNFFIIAVPTPINKSNKPNLKFLKTASLDVGKIMKKNSIVVYESTVYPGATEEICIPILEKNSSLIANKDFFYGYSPERINPGDKVHTIENITKVVSGSNLKTTNKINKIYSSVINRTYIAESIMVAEAAKIIENTQRDLNIALINELSTFFNKLNIDTNQVINAASSKWNFIDFRPGLVGGHCIGVDPFYLTYKMKKLKISPKVILSGRTINDAMGKIVANSTIELMRKKKIKIKNSNVLVLGFSFKENCSDFRNTKVIDIILQLEKNKCKVDISDYLIDTSKANEFYKLNISKDIIMNKKYDAIILAVGHKKYQSINIDFLNQFLNNKSVFFDVKSTLKKELSDGRL